MPRLIVCIVLLFCFNALDAQTFNAGGGSIPDGGPRTCFPLAVSGIGTINGSYGLASVCLNITHTYVSDLEIYLKAPDGTMVPLSLQNGAPGMNYTGTCFTATAATLISAGTAPFTGNFLPTGMLGAINNGQNANGVWNLCVQDMFAPDAGALLNWSLLFNNTPATPLVIPANDEPCNAITLAVGSNCSFTSFTTENATGTNSVAPPACANYMGGDIWFRVTVPAGGSLIFDTQTGAVINAGMAIYSGSCSSLSLIACDDNSSANGLMPMIAASGLTPGSSVWIRVWDYGNASPGSFGICVSTPPPPPSNDDPCNAISIPVGNTCSYSSFTNIGATATTGLAVPGCGNYQGGDVWFKVVVPAGGAVFFDSNIGTMSDGDIAIYGGSCNALSLLSCDDLSSNNGAMGAITLAGQTPGSTLWVRVWNNGGSNAGTFQLCASLPPPPTVQDCPAAIPICQNVYNEPISYTGTGSIANEINPAISCMSSGERADVWYTFTVQTAGNVNFTITPHLSTEDYDWAVYNVTGTTCAQIFSDPALNVSCNFSATQGSTGPNGGSTLSNQASGGSPYNAVIPVLAGQTYVINISNYTLSSNGYTIDFGASTASIFDNKPPVLQSPGAAANCGGNQLTVNFSENVLCSSVQKTDFSLSGPGGPYTITGWSSASCTSGATYGNNITLTVSPALSTNGAFQLCLTNASGSVTDLCGNVAVPACLNFNIATTVPVFSAVPAICYGATAPVLPAISINGISGSWSPAIVSNTASGTYTFTAAAGQCATTASLTVTVNPGIVPAFTAFAALCYGAAAPILPLTSNNGITGLWSPSTVNNTTTGTYTFTPNTGQCAAPTTLTVIVRPLAVSTTNMGICTNQLPYTWNGQTYSIAGPYTVHLLNAAGCDSSATLNLTVKSNTSSTTNISICANQLPYTWNGQTYATGGPHVVHLLNVAGCDSSATLNLSVKSNSTSTTNISICSNQLPYTWNGQNYSTAGPYTVHLLNAAGCDSSATLNLTVKANSTSTTNISICSNQLPYTWNWQTYGTGGPHVVHLLNAAGCDSSATLNLTVKANSTSTTNISICSNQLPYTWNGQTYATGGPHVVHLLNAAGCDSSATLNLTVKSNTSSTTNIFICSNQLPYTWNGQTYATSGPHVVHLLNAAGCDSSATLNLTVKANTSSTTNISICSNQLPYTWNGQTYATGGPNIVHLLNAAGCDSSATLNLTVKANSISTTNISICSNQLPYTWNGQTYTSGGPYTVHLLNAAGCDSSATLNLTVKANSISTTNITICSNQLPYTWNGQTYTSGGPYTVHLLNAAGCDSSATLNLTVKANSISTTNITICSNQLPYTWNGQTYTSGGPYTVHLLNAAGCDSSATLNLTVKANSISTTNISICANQLPYTWNGQTYVSGGPHIVHLLNTAGCDSSATLNLTVKSITSSTTNISICSNQLPYTWNGQTYATAGPYVVHLLNAAGCDSAATLNLTVKANTSSTTNISICSNQLPYTWNGQTYGTGGPHVVHLLNAAGCDSSATLNLTVKSNSTSTTNISICSNQLPYTWNGQTYTSGGLYTVHLLNTTGCDSSATLNLTVKANSTSTTNISICSNQLPYTWNGQTYSTGGPYIIHLLNTAGCDSLATLNLTVKANSSSTTNISICANQLPYTWNGQTYVSGGPHIVHLLNTAGCDSSATLNLTVKSITSSTTNISICSNQLPYSWNGLTYTTGGLYIVHLLNAAGCDSIATLNLTANSSVTSTTNTTICSNQLPYSWNGHSYSIGGTYAVTLTNISGCDSVATLHLTVNNVLASTTTVSICSNQLPYSWNGNSYTNGGMYSVPFISSAGCDSITTLHLTIKSNTTSTTNISICSNQLPYSWNGQTYAVGGPHVVHLVNAAGCDSSATLNLTVKSNTSSTTNISICSNQLPYTWNGQTYTSGGPYTVHLLNAAGCDSAATLNLTVKANTSSTTNISICANQLPYTWNGQTYATAGPYTVHLLNAAGCDSSATLNLTVKSNTSSTTNIAVCSNQLPYTWNGQTYATAGPYTVHLLNAAGCDSAATLNLTVKANTSSTTNISICSNQLPYSWNGQTYTIGGLYTVHLINAAGCDSIATLNLTANSSVSSTTNTTICSNQLPYSWNGQTCPIAGTYAVTLTSNSGCDSVTTLHLTVNTVLVSTTSIAICSNQLPYSWNGHSYSNGGSYSVTLTSSTGCDSIANLNLSVNNIISSSTNITICSNQLPYLWNSHSYSIGGIYSVTLTSNAGCDSTATLNLSVNNILTSTTNIAICSNQLPYSWNGHSYSNGGSYSVTLTGSVGCDSIATLNLSVNNVLTSSTNISICSNQLPYSWNGHSYLIGGNYSVTLTGSVGCDSIATLNLSVNNVLTSSTNISICSNQLPYSWNGHSYLIGGNYSVTLTSSAGCDSIATLNLSVNSILSSTTNNTICSNQLPYSWNGHSYSIGGNYSVTLTSSAGCDSIATLNLSVNSILSSTTNNTICSNQLPYSWNGHSYTIGGNYSVTLTSSAGCDSVATLNLSVNNILSSTTNNTICSNQLPYYWNGHSYITGGTYAVTLTSSAGCDSVATLNLSVNNVLTSSTNIAICSNQLPYSWNGHSYSIGGNYSVTLTSSAGCDSIATLNLSVNNILSSTTNSTICSNQLPYSWNGHSYITGGNYSVTLTSSAGCDSVATLNLSVNNVLTSTTNSTICSNQLPYSWNGHSYTTGGNYSVTLTGSVGCDSIATLNLSVNNVLTSSTNISICSNQLPYSWNGHSYLIGGNYSVTLTSSAGCDSIATLNLSVNSILSSTTNNTICSNQLPYSWNGHSYSIGGNYSVTLTSSAGCDSIATLNLSVNSILSSTTNNTICSNQLPYSWNGHSYTIGGNYSVTLTSSAGCDSVATLNLSVNNILSSTTNNTICSNQLPYYWNGHSYITGGSYSVTLTSSAGCDSIATLNLSVNSILTSTTNSTICSNQLPYSWNGHSYSIGGNYSVTLTSSAGCDSIATLNLSVNNILSSTTNSTICSNQLPYSWNGHSYTTGGNHSVTLTSSVGCDSIATLNLTVNNVLTSATNSTICSNQLPYSWNGHSYTNGGNYSVTLTSSAGCDSVATLNLSVNNVLTSTTNISICSNQLPYSWNGHSYTTGGNYSVTLTGSAGCDSIATLNLSVNNVSASTTNITICSGQLPYLWNGRTCTTTGLYTATLNSNNGCDSIATLNLSVNQSPAPPVVTASANYCQHAVASVLTASAVGNLLWYNAAIGGSGSPIAPLPSTAVAGTYHYYVSQLNATCESPRVMITVQVNNIPSLGADKNIRICNGKSADLHALYNNNSYTGNWMKDQSPVLRPDSVTVAGLYQYIATNSSGCADTVLVNVAIQPAVIAFAGNDDKAESNIPYRLSASGGISYEWSPGSPYLDNPYVASPLAVLTHDTRFTLIAKDDIGCVGFDTVNIKVFNGPAIYMPNAFSPNGDGLNDLFRPTSVGIKSLEYFRVYNRYSELIFESHDLSKGWDGSFKGVKQNTGNYVWVLKAMDRMGVVREMKGSILLVR